MVDESNTTMAKGRLNEAVQLAEHVEKINGLKVDTRKTEVLCLITSRKLWTLRPGLSTWQCSLRRPLCSSGRQEGSVKKAAGRSAETLKDIIFPVTEKKNATSEGRNRGEPDAQNLKER